MIQTHGRDKSKRTLAHILLPDGANLNHTLDKNGWCWWYRKYAPGDTVLEGLETEARKERKAYGLTRAGAAVGVAETEAAGYQAAGNCP